MTDLTKACLVASIAAACLPGSAAQTALGRPPLIPCNVDTVWAYVTVDRYRDMALLPDSASAESLRFYGIDLTDPADTEIVRDPVVCDHAARAYYRDQGWDEPFSGRHLGAARIGDYYVVSDERNRAGEWTIAVTFTRDWLPIARLAQ
jgi:hypothetical protein